MAIRSTGLLCNINYKHMLKTAVAEISMKSNLDQ